VALFATLLFLGTKFALLLPWLLTINRPLFSTGSILSHNILNALIFIQNTKRYICMSESLFGI